MHFLSFFVASFGLSVMLIWTFSKLYYRLNLLDNPSKYGKKRAPIPYSMGVVLFLGLFVLTICTQDWTYKLSLIWVFGGMITLVSFLDDRFRLSPKMRLLMQIGIGAIIGLTAIKIGYVSTIFGSVIDLEKYFIEIWQYKVYLVSFVFTVIWYVFLFNATNWSDGIEGNTAGLATISFFVLFLLGWNLQASDLYDAGIKNAEFIMSLSVIMVGMLIPFWWCEVKQKILMGDSGTMFLGFMLATLAIISGGKIATVMVVFGIYIVDAVYVIIQRLLKGKNPLEGDTTHLHHRLLALGWSKPIILVYLTSASLAFGIASLFVGKFGKIALFIGIIGFVILSPYLLSKWNTHETK